MELKAIETVYKGYRFRSRLEARWAVFFDALGIKWEYEKEGFDLGDAGWYLPDFWLPEIAMWAEVKAQKLNDEESEKALQLWLKSGHPVIELVGIPECCAYDAWVNVYQGSDGLCAYNIGFYLTNKTVCGGHIPTSRDIDIDRYTTEYIDDPDSIFDAQYRSAVRKARQVRFEHGECPQ